jgi:ABC-2 type transport system permease protein
MIMLTWLSNVFRLGLKELASLVSDKVLFAFIIYSFSFSVYSVATGVKTEIENASIAVVDGDRSALSSRLREAFLRPYFRPPAVIDRAELDPVMDDGERTFVLDIPPRFEADALRGRQPELQLNIDATAMTQAGVGAGYIDAIVQREAADFLQARGDASAVPVKTVSRVFFNPNLEGAWFHSVMSVMENITILSILLVGAAVIREREHGTIEHLLVMPVTLVELMLSKIWSMGLVVLLVSTFSLIVVVQGLLAVPIAGALWLFVLGAALDVIAATAIGIALATMAGSMPQFGLLTILILLPLQVLSGSSTPRESMPEIVQALMLAAPNTHFVMLAQSVLFRGAGIEDVWSQLLALVAISLLLLMFSLRRFRGFLK